MRGDEEHHRRPPEPTMLTFLAAMIVGTAWSYLVVRLFERLARTEDE